VAWTPEAISGRLGAALPRCTSRRADPARLHACSRWLRSPPSSRARSMAQPSSDRSDRRQPQACHGGTARISTKLLSRAPRPRVQLGGCSRRPDRRLRSSPERAGGSSVGVPVERFSASQPRPPPRCQRRRQSPPPGAGSPWRACAGPWRVVAAAEAAASRRQPVRGAELHRITRPRPGLPVAAQAPVRVSASSLRSTCRPRSKRRPRLPSRARLRERCALGRDPPRAARG
jgi:hypothetical protein